MSASENGDIHTKKQILMTLGQNPVIKDGKIYIEANEWLKTIQKEYPKLESEFLRLEPEQSQLNNDENGDLLLLKEKWGTMRYAF